MANREEGAAAPNQRQGQNQQDQQQNHDAVGQQHIHINWSNFKPEFSGKPEEDAEAHLLCSNDWMHAHHFNEDIKVQRFCLTLLGVARLWFQPLRVRWYNMATITRIYLDKGIQSWVIHVNSYFMHGDHSISMKILKL